MIYFVAYVTETLDISACKSSLSAKWHSWHNICMIKPNKAKQ